MDDQGKTLNLPCLYSTADWETYNIIKNQLTRNQVVEVENMINYQLSNIGLSKSFWYVEERNKNRIITFTAPENVSEDRIRTVLDGIAKTYNVELSFEIINKYS